MQKTYTFFGLWNGHKSEASSSAKGLSRRQKQDSISDAEEGDLVEEEGRVSDNKSMLHMGSGSSCVLVVEDAFIVVSFYWGGEGRS